MPTMKRLTDITLGLSLLGLATTVQAEEIKFNVVSFTPKTAVVSHGFELFIDAINEEFEGELELNWRGGPEVLPPFRLADAVRNGSIDMAMVSPSYYSGLVPSSTTSNLSLKSYEEIQATGYYQRMTEIHADRGLHYLGEIPATDVKFFIFLNEKVAGPDELEGKRIRVFPTILPFVKALGAEPLVLPMGEIYTAMERGVIDGFAQSNLGWVDQFTDVVNYYITPSFYRAGFNVLVNPEAWTGLPPELRTRVQDYVRNELALQIDDSWDEIIATGYRQMEEAGFQEIALTGEEGEAYLDLALEAAWGDYEAKIEPDLHAELKRMLVD